MKTKYNESEVITDQDRIEASNLCWLSFELIERYESRHVMPRDDEGIAYEN